MTNNYLLYRFHLKLETRF